ncbi:hypothetical protein [uncultured Roseobacter sp.]|uniref:hypothetical protein n=1 Tax=uncultured Roseobacter sp. TaxID=114847 RepID=UPI002609453E|nr:hypothetical protein [uncultured Roseobacter sp.]
MSFSFDLDSEDVKVLVCPNTDKALAYLSKCHAVCEQLMVTRLEIHNLKFKRWLINPLEFEAPPVPTVVIDQMLAETKGSWNNFLTISIERFGETATINAQFLLGDPQLPPA